LDGRRQEGFVSHRLLCRSVQFRGLPSQTLAPKPREHLAYRFLHGTTSVREPPVLHEEVQTSQHIAVERHFYSGFTHVVHFSSW